MLFVSRSAGEAGKQNYRRWHYILISQFGKSADISDDLPTPECPERTEVLF